MVANSIEVDTVQGVGDIIWVMQKLTPYFDVIHLNILCISNDIVQHRAEKFIRLLPKVGRISYRQVSPSQYDAVAKKRFVLREVMGPPYIIGPKYYAVNRPLEEGIRLEKIDPEMNVNWSLKFNVQALEYLPFLKEFTPTYDYDVLYVSGNKSDTTWTWQTWAGFYLSYYFRNPGNAVVLLGAEYDREPLEKIGKFLSQHGIAVAYELDGEVDRCIRCIRECRTFVGYQSGLNVIADMYDRKQVMIYFPQLKPMLYSWCKPGHRESGLFKAFTFDQDPMQILEQVK